MELKEFGKIIAGDDELSRVEQAIAILWFFRNGQLFDDRTASELAEDVRETGLGKPNVTKLKFDLTKDKRAVKGLRKDSFQFNAKYLDEYNRKYLALFEKTIQINEELIPKVFVNKTRPYLEKMVYQINGTFECGFFDGCAVLIRRLCETLLIDVFVNEGIDNEIKDSKGNYLGFDNLITKASQSSKIKIGRNTKAHLPEIKLLGDTAAHDRFYITQKDEIFGNKLKIRHVVQDLLSNANIIPK